MEPDLQPAVISGIPPRCECSATSLAVPLGRPSTEAHPHVAPKRLGEPKPRRQALAIRQAIHPEGDGTTRHVVAIQYYLR